MGWNKAMRAWTGEGPKKAARRRGGRQERKRYDITEHDGAWCIEREMWVTPRGEKLLNAAIWLAARLG